MLNNYEILDYFAKKKLYKGYGVAQTDSKQIPGANYLLYKNGADKFYFVQIVEQKKEERQEDGKIKKQDPIAEVIELESFRFSDFKAVQYDKYTLAKRYIFTSKKDETLTVKTWLASVELVTILPKHIELKKVDRKWYNNLIGFRSNNPKKMITAGLIYLVVLTFLVQFIFFK